MVVARPLKTQTSLAAAGSESDDDDDLEDSSALEARIRERRRESATGAPASERSALPPITHGKASADADAIETAEDDSRDASANADSDRAESNESDASDKGKDLNAEHQSEINDDASAQPKELDEEGKITKFFKNLRPKKSEVIPKDAGDDPKEAGDDSKKEGFFNRMGLRGSGKKPSDPDPKTLAGEEHIVTDTAPSNRSFFNRLSFKKGNTEQTEDMSKKNEDSLEKAGDDGADQNEEGSTNTTDKNELSNADNKKEKKHVRISEEIESIHSSNNRQLPNRKSKLCTVL